MISTSTNDLAALLGGITAGRPGPPGPQGPQGVAGPPVSFLLVTFQNGVEPPRN